MKHIKLGNEEVSPSKIICIGRNYVDHIEELKNEIPSEMVVFIKPNSSISNEIYYNAAEKLHYEGELVFLIRDAEIFAVGFGLDLTKRETQSRLKNKGLPWERAKAFDHSAVLSPFVKLEGDLSLLKMELYINGELAQSGGYELMLNKPDEILNEVKGFISLEDDDLIMTGTPKGVGEINIGDTFEGRVYQGDKILLKTLWTVEIK